MKEIVVLCASDALDRCERIADSLVEKRLAACVQIVSGICSFYRWQGKMCRNTEHLLIIKSTADKFESIRMRIHELHDYEVPEIIALPVSAGDPEYLAWMRASVEGV